MISLRNWQLATGNRQPITSKTVLYLLVLGHLAPEIHILSKKGPQSFPAGNEVLLDSLQS